MRARAAIGMVMLLSACAGTASSPSPSVSQDAEAVFRAFNAAVSAGDAAGAAALVADDARFYGRSVDANGVDGLVASLACTAEVTSADDQGDTVILELEFTGPSPLTDLEDCPVGGTGQARVTVRDGKIVEIAEAD